ncbi:MAG: amidase [Desulfomicrobium sp.]|nr:amidase [Pseudomonadota bacterium]MBV1710547.1 amidase [Desulfomicrobium sp.]MBU4570155.1 amidase [Pseudomonadota bacterium]MBU4593075.1 amidase [Pseudomonadota bacterium]MBV1718884.1 amidase [Desulfomicrobium sp.]
MSLSSFINAMPNIEAYRAATQDELRDMVRRHIALARSLDRSLHILAREIDQHAIDEQIEGLFSRFPGQSRRPALFGVPVGVKDIFRVDGALIRCGSLLPPMLFEGPEAECVRTLRDAGAIIFAQTATTEFAYFEPAATRNPHNPAHTPGGSSSGSAAGVAAGLFPLALGTQTVGSIVRPAAFCGVVGMKPSLGKIPTAGVVFFSPTVDHVGFFCRQVADISRVMEAFDPRWTAGGNTEHLGVPVGKYFDQVPQETMEWFEGVVSTLVAAGVDVVRVPCLGNIEEIASRHRDLIAAEFALEQDAWFKDYAHLYRPATRDIILKGRTVSETRLAETRESCTALRRELCEIMDGYGLDLWICPSTLGEAPAGLCGTGSPAMNLPWTHAGLPVISLPCGEGPGGLPLGLQCIGRFGEDHRLVDAVLSLESRILMRGPK